LIVSESNKKYTMYNMYTVSNITAYLCTMLLWMNDDWWRFQNYELNTQMWREFFKYVGEVLV